MFLIDDLLLAPAKGLLTVFKTIHDQAMEELYSPTKIQEALMKLQLQFELDEITEEEYDEQEAVLLERLDQAQEMRKKST